MVMSNTRSLYDKIKRLYQLNFNLTSHRLLAEVLEKLNIAPIVELTANYILSDTDAQCFLQSQLDTNIDILIPDDLQVGSVFCIERLGTGTITVGASGTVSLNGIDGGEVSIANQWSSVYLRVYAPNKVKAEGNIV